MLFNWTISFFPCCADQKPKGKLGFNAKSLVVYAKQVEFHFGSISDLYQELDGKPVYYDGELSVMSFILPLIVEITYNVTGS